MIAKITYPTKTEFIQIRGYQRFDVDGDISYLIDVNGEIEHEVTAYEILIDDGARNWESKEYQTVEFLTDALVCIESIEFKGDDE